MRHPLECRYFRDHNRCKFNSYCKFKHVEKNSYENNECRMQIKVDSLESEIKSLKEYLEDFKTIMHEVLNNLRGKDVKQGDVECKMEDAFVTPTRCEKTVNHMGRKGDDDLMKKMDEGSLVQDSARATAVTASGFPPWSYKTP